MRDTFNFTTMNTFKGLPIFQAEISDLDEGLFDISLVDFPATKQDFVTFDQDKMMFQVQDEERHIVSGVVMAANQLIYRRSPKLGEYYLTFSPETIEAMVLKMFKEGKQNNVTLMHNNQLVPGVTMLEMFIKDEKRGINPSYLQNVPDGSVIASYKVENQELWELIKQGEFRGFSITGLFSIMPEDEPSELDDIMNLIHQVKGKYGLK